MPAVVPRRTASGLLYLMARLIVASCVLSPSSAAKKRDGHREKRTIAGAFLVLAVQGVAPQSPQPEQDERRGRGERDDLQRDDAGEYASGGHGQGMVQEGCDEDR
jgi:hypothetical protein